MLTCLVKSERETSIFWGSHGKGPTTIVWEFFNHASLPFGLTSACYLFDQIADSLQLVMKHRGHHPPLHIISMILLVFLAISMQPVLHLTLWNQLPLRQVLKYMIQNQNLSGPLEFSSVWE